MGAKIFHLTHLQKHKDVQAALDSNTEKRSPDNNCTWQLLQAVPVIFIWKRRIVWSYFTLLLLKAGAVKWHFTVTVKSLHVAGGAQQHTLRPSRAGDGDISSSLLLPSTVGVKGGLQRGTVSHWWPPGGNHDTETHPPPHESLLGLAGCPCAGDHPEWPPPTSGPEHPTAPATHSDCEDQTMPLTVLGNLALNFSREKESWGRCMTSLGEFSCRIETTWKHPRHPEEMTANYG